MQAIVTDAEQAELHQCMRRVLVAMVIADGDTDPDELVCAQQTYQRLTGETLDTETFAREAEAMKSLGVGVANCLGSLAGALGDEERFQILRAAFEVAVADGFVLEEEDTMLAAVAASLGMNEAAYKEAMGRLMAGGL